MYSSIRRTVTQGGSVISYNEAIISPKASQKMLVTRRSRQCQCVVLMCVTALLGRNTQAEVTLMDRHGLPSVPGDLASSHLSSTPALLTAAAGSHMGPQSTLNHSVNQQDWHMMVNYWIVALQFYVTRKISWRIDERWMCFTFRDRKENKNSDGSFLSY